MAETTVANTGAARPGGLQGIAADWASDQRAFKNVSWGKAMMWIFLLSDTFIFGCFLLAYMTARMSTPVPWPNPSEVFALNIGGLIALAVVIVRAWTPQWRIERLRLSVELCAMYWHFLLFIWLAVFVLLAGWAADFIDICRQLLT